MLQYTVRVRPIVTGLSYPVCVYHSKRRANNKLFATLTGIRTVLSLFIRFPYTGAVTRIRCEVSGPNWPDRMRGGMVGNH